MSINLGKFSKLKPFYIWKFSKSGGGREFQHTANSNIWHEHFCAFYPLGGALMSISILHVSDLSFLWIGFIIFQGLDLSYSIGQIYHIPWVRFTRFHGSGLLEKFTKINFLWISACVNCPIFWAYILWSDSQQKQHLVRIVCWQVTSVATCH